MTHKGNRANIYYIETTLLANHQTQDHQVQLNGAILITRTAFSVSTRDNYCAVLSTGDCVITVLQFSPVTISAPVPYTYLHPLLLLSEGKVGEAWHLQRNALSNIGQHGTEKLFHTV